MSLYLLGFVRLAVLVLAAVLYGLGVLALVLLCCFAAFCVFSRKPPRQAWYAVRTFLKENYND